MYTLVGINSPLEKQRSCETLKTNQCGYVVLVRVSLTFSIGACKHKQANTLEES